MQAKKRLIVGSFLVLSSAAIAVAGAAARPDAGSSAAEEDRRAEVFERTYKLTKAQAEVLALLLKLDMPRDTSVKTDSKNGNHIVISGPKAVHDAVAPLVTLLANQRASRTEEQAAKIKERMIEMENNFNALDADRLRRRQR